MASAYILADSTITKQHENCRTTEQIKRPNFSFIQPSVCKPSQKEVGNILSRNNRSCRLLGWRRLTI